MENDNEPKVSVSEVLNMLSKLISPEDVIFAKITAQFVSVLTQIRKDKEMSVEEFADLLDMDTEIVTEWETGHHNFNLKEIANICCVLDLDIDFVITIKEDESVED